MIQLRLQCVVLMLFAAPAWAVDINVGGRMIAIPVPDGFVELTSDMQPYYQTLSAYVPPSNTMHLVLVPEETATRLLDGDLVELEKYAVIQSHNDTNRLVVSRSIFEEMRTVMRSELSTLADNMQSELSGIMEQGNEAVSDEFDVDLEVSVGDIVTLPMHVDTDKAIAYSQFIGYAAAVAGDEGTSSTVAATAMFLHVADKLIFVYVYAPQDDVEWTQQFAADWHDDIFAANPVSESVAESIDAPASDGFEWGGVLQMALIGGAIGLAIAVFGAIARRRKTG